MSVSIELFLLDNLAMNYLSLRLAEVLCGTKARQWKLLLAAGLGAGYALLSMTAAPFLRNLLPKLLLCLLMALPVSETWRAYGKALFCTVLSVSLMGGMMLGLTALFGGGFYNGVSVGTVPVRIALLSAVLFTFLPRMVLTMIHVVRAKPERIRVRIVLSDRTLELVALIDSGNLLTEPISGLPVIVVRPGLLPMEGGRPVPYRTVDGEGVMYALRPKEVSLAVKTGWQRVNACVASAFSEFRSADAIVGSILLGNERWESNDRTVTLEQEHQAETPSAVLPGDSLHTLRGDVAASVPAGAGAGVDTTTYGR